MFAISFTTLLANFVHFPTSPAPYSLSLSLSVSQSSFYVSRGLFYVLYIYTVSLFSLEAEIRSVQLHVGIYLCSTLLQCFRWWSLHKPYFKWYSVVLVSVTVTLTEKVSLLVELCVGSLVKQFDIDNTYCIRAVP